MARKVKLPLSGAEKRELKELGQRLRKAGFSAAGVKRRLGYYQRVIKDARS